VSSHAVGDAPTLEELGERAAAAVAGAHRSCPDHVEAMLDTGRTLIESWSPRIVIDGMPFVLDRPTGSAHHRDGSTAFRAAWRAEFEAAADLVLHTDGGVSAFLAEVIDPFGQGFIYHVSDGVRRRLVEAQSEIDVWLGRDTWSGSGRMLAAYLAEREPWLALTSDEVLEAITRHFVGGDGLRRIVPSPVVTAPICEYLAVAFLRFDPARRETLMVLLGDGMSLLTAVATARAL
jgi:hypothetical protein